MKKLSTMVAAILVFSAGAVQAQQTADTSGQDSWIHVRVEEEGTQKVSLNLPLPLIDVALRNRSGDGFAEDLRLGDRHVVSVEDLPDGGEAETQDQGRLQSPDARLGRVVCHPVYVVVSATNTLGGTCPRWSVM